MTARSTTCSSRSTSPTTRWPPATRSAACCRSSWPASSTCSSCPMPPARLRAELRAAAQRESRLLDDGALATGPHVRPRLPPELDRCARALAPGRAGRSDRRLPRAPPPRSRFPPRPRSDGPTTGGLVFSPAPSTTASDREPAPRRRRARRPNRPSTRTRSVPATRSRRSRAPTPRRRAAPGVERGSATRPWRRTANVIEPGWVLVVGGDPAVEPIPTPTPAPARRRRRRRPRCSRRRRPPDPDARRNRVSAGSAQTFRTIPDAGPGVALTFDMGGRMDPAVDIMNFLVDQRGLRHDLRHRRHEPDRRRARR